jgi:hypothetical protein
MKYLFCVFFLSNSLILIAQNQTNISLFFKNDSSVYLSEVSSEDGDLFSRLGHHGPAVENEWLGFRFYFDKRGAIDVYSKHKPALELRKAKWYPTPEQQKEGWGADYYKVGNTVGLGGVRLWDGEKVVLLNPVSKRSVKVNKEGITSCMDILSNDIPYKGRTVDVLVRLTVFSGLREAKVEVFALCNEPIQFVIGINYHPGQTVIKKENYIITWGLHPEDVAADKAETGAAILFDPEKFEDSLDDGSQWLLISNPAKILEYWITSANEKESEINSLMEFDKLVRTISN